MVVGIYSLNLDRDVTGCSVLATPVSYNRTVATLQGPDATQVRIFIRDEPAGDESSPTYYDDSFYVSVVC